jgi:hypothetical protein
LSLLVASAHAPMVQMMLPRIKDRVNAAYGYAAVSRISLTQTTSGGFAEAQAAFDGPRKVAPQDPEAQRIAMDVTASVGDTDLRSALEALGKSILIRKRTEPRKSDP